MAGAQSTGVDEALVNKIKQVLMDSKDDLYKVHVAKPAAGTLGGSATANRLETLMNRATDRINSTLSETNEALVNFVDGLDDALREVKKADADAETAFRKMDTAADLISKPFFENLMKDDRLDLPDLPLPFFPVSGETLEEIASRSEYGQDKEG
jgi:flagellar hook-basal body complex protein FliE